MMRPKLWNLLTALCILVLACSGGEITGPVQQGTNENLPASVVITPPASPDMVVGAIVTLPITVKSASGQAISTPVTWSSSDATVASVSQSGVVTAIGLGTAVITGSVSGRSAAVTINVRPAASLVSRVSVTLRTTLLVGDSATASYAALDVAGNIVPGRTVTWRSRDLSIARVSSTGVVTAVGAGTTTIDAEVDGITGSATLVATMQALTVNSVRVTTPDSTAVVAGTTVQATAIVIDNVGNVMTGNVIAWSSSNPAVATVSPTGLITSVSNGTALITASTAGKSGFALFVVNIPSVLPVASVAVTAPRTSLFATLQTQAVATLRDAAGTVLTGRPITWASGCPSVATVTASGLITGVALGSCVITATSQGIVGSITVQVVATPLASLSITTTATNIPVGITTQLNAVLRDSLNAVVTQPTTWVSASPTVATVSAAGLVTGVAAGTSLISATSAGLNASVTITVNAPLVPPVATVTVSAPATTVQPNQGEQASVVTKDASNNVLTGRVINWSSSNNAVATITPLGYINPTGSGTTTITAVSEGKSGSITISVPPVATVTVGTPQSTLQPTQTTQATATLLDAAATPALNRTVVWTSTNTAVATVSATGLVTGVAGGTTSITAKSEGITGTKTITIPAVATVTVTGTNLSLIPQQSTQLTATLLDAASSPALNRTISWQSSSPSVAVVSQNGLVTALTAGTAVITATSETKTGSATITVVQPTVTSITITNNSPMLFLTQASQLTTVILDSQGRPTTTITPVWTSGNPAKASVSANGLVTAVGGGTGANVVFSATVGNVTSTTTINVVGHPVETQAALPNTFLSTAAPAAPAPGGVVHSATSSAGLTAALNAAQPGDVIELANGVTFTGNFILPNKNTTSQLWITIRPASSSGLPAQGSRMTPSIAAAANLPIVASPSNRGAFETAAGAHHYRLIGLEVRATVTNTGLIRLGSDGTVQTNLSQVPHDLVLDRMYIHGSSSIVLRRCVVLNSASTAVIDSHVADCHDSSSDSQAIAGWNGPGPFKIVNNYLESAGENIMFGGSDPGVPGLIPSDIEVRHNHLTRPTSWKGVWQIKNLFELKNAARVLVEGNIFENNWIDAQTGTAIVLKSANQDATAPWSGTRDVTFRLNVIRNVGGGFAIQAINDARPGVVSFHTARLTITDNIVYSINQGVFDGSGNGFLLAGDPSDVIIAHNTVISPTDNGIAMSPTGYAMARLSVRDNVLNLAQYGIHGDGLAGGTVSLNAYASAWSMFANVFVYWTSAGYPLGNYFPTAVSGVGFVSAGSFDFHLASSSSFRNKSTEMTDPGANIDAVMTATSGAIVP